MATNETPLPDVAPMQAQGSELVARAQALKIVTNDDYKAAGEMLVAVASLRKTITAAFEPPKKAAHEAHKKITELEKKQLDAPQRAEAILKTEMSAYLRAEDARRKEEEAKAQAALRKQEEERRLAEATKLEAAGHQAEAEQVLDAPLVVAPVELEKPKAAGISATKRWAYRVSDPAKVNRPFLLLDDKKIGQTVRNLGMDAVAFVGGIEVYEDFGISARGAREAA